MKNYDVLNELVPKTQELHRAIFDKGYEQGQKDILEQLCYDDCISRQAVLNTLDKMDKALDTDRTVENYKELLTECYKDLPLIMPTKKIGKWIDEADKIDAQYGRHTYKFSKCGKYAEYFVSGTEVWWDRIKPNFCPNCGIRMVEPQESEG